MTETVTRKVVIRYSADIVDQPIACKLAKTYDLDFNILKARIFPRRHFKEAAANLMTIDALDPQAKIPEYKACAVRLAPAPEDELPHPEARLARGRW